MNVVSNLVIADIIYKLDNISDISSLLSINKRFDNFSKTQTGFWKRYNREKIFLYLSDEEWLHTCNQIKRWNHLSHIKILQYMIDSQPISYIRYIIIQNPNNYKKLILNKYDLSDFYVALILQGIDYTKDSELNNYFDIIGDPIYHSDIKDYILNDSTTDITIQDNNAIKIASSMNHGEIVRILLKDPRVDPTTNKNYAIRNATWKNYYYISSMLLSWEGVNGERIDPRELNNSAIRWACFNGSTECIQLLLDWSGPNGERINIHAKKSEAIRFANKSRNKDTKTLIEEYTKLDNILE